MNNNYLKLCLQINKSFNCPCVSESVHSILFTSILFLMISDNSNPASFSILWTCTGLYQARWQVTKCPFIIWMSTDSQFSDLLAVEQYAPIRNEN